MQKGAISCAFCDPAGIRTQDPYIKSVLLYQLSYGIVVCATAKPLFPVWNSGAKIELSDIRCKLILRYFYIFR